MAQAIAVDEAQKNNSSHSFSSAGIATSPGAPASPLAQEIMTKQGIDLSAHQSRQVDKILMKAADRIYTMTEAHANVLRQAFPEYSNKISTYLEGQDIPDPFGGSLQDYEASAKALRAGLARIMQEEE